MESALRLIFKLITYYQDSCLFVSLFFTSYSQSRWNNDIDIVLRVNNKLSNITGF